MSISRFLLNTKKLNYVHAVCSYAGNQAHGIKVDHMDCIEACLAKGISAYQCWLLIHSDIAVQNHVYDELTFDGSIKP
jgi:hypothetical protein